MITILLLLTIAEVQHQDLFFSVRPDGDCRVVAIRNELLGANFVSSFEFDSIHFEINRGDGELPDSVSVVPPIGWWADPYELTIAEETTAEVLLCREIGS